LRRIGLSWRLSYLKKTKSPSEAIKLIERGDKVFVGSRCGEPKTLLRALLESLSTEKKDISIFSLDACCKEHLALTERTHATFFNPSSQLRSLCKEGKADYIPLHHSEIPHLFRTGQISLDVALIQVSFPDEYGFCSFGVSVDISKAAAESAKIVIAEVNRRVPRTFGDSFIHINDIDFVVESDEPLPQYPLRRLSDIAKKIASYAVSIIEDGSTLQIGFGEISDALYSLLEEKRELGIHTEFFSEGLLRLVEKGVITNSVKTLHNGRVVASYCLGTNKLYDFVNNNPFFEFHPLDYVTNPIVISQNEKMVAVNCAKKVDLMGNLLIEPEEGGLAHGVEDFMRGASLSKGGKAIILLPSKRKGRSAIVPSLSLSEEWVVRSHPQYVVTEYGIACLHGRSIRERALALINVSHPSFREKLMAEAKKRGIFSNEKREFSVASINYPDEFETHSFDKKGAKIFMRPIKPTDEQMVRDLFYSFSKETIYYRFLSWGSSTLDESIKKILNIDYDKEMVSVAIVKEKNVEKIVGIASYSLDPSTGFAEVAIAIQDDWQNRGIGTLLFRHITELAKKKGVKGFVAYISDRNRKASRLIQKIEAKIEARWEEGVYKVLAKFNER